MFEEEAASDGEGKYTIGTTDATKDGGGGGGGPAATRKELELIEKDGDYDLRGIVDV